MWFGTRNGLNRFDGNVFKVFKNDSKDSTSIGSNSILSLYEDEKHQLFIGTYKGVYLFNPINETFSLVKKIPQEEVWYLNSDKNYNLWFAIGFKIYKLNHNTQTLDVYDITKTQLPVINVDLNGNVIVGGDSGIIKKYDSKRNCFIDFTVSTISKKKENIFIQSINQVNDSIILIATTNKVLLLNNKTNTIKKIFSLSNWSNNFQVHKIQRKSDSIFWIGTENGLYILNIQSGLIQSLQKNYANPYSLTDNIIHDIFKDKEGNIWVGSFFGGLSYYSIQQNYFKKYFPVVGINSLNGNLVHEIVCDKQDNLWIGTEDGGLNKMEKKTGIIKHFMPGKDKGSIAYQNIHGLLADDNELWIGTLEHGLDVLDLKTEKVIRHYIKNDNPNSLNSNFIVTIYKTREGKILIGTWGGLFEFDRINDNFISLPFFNRQAQSVIEDENGTLWVCSYGNGVYFQNTKTGQQGCYKYDANDSNSITNNYVNNIFEDSKKNFWFCTESGICKLDYNSKKIIRFSNKFPINNNQIFRILEDEKGTLWMSTSKGLVSMLPDGNELKIYNENNGILSNQFNYNSSYKSKDGQLFFGTVKGMISFYPLSLSKNLFVPPVYITNILVNNQEYKIRDIITNKEQSISYTAEITLPYDSSNITISLAALSFSIPGENEYTYKMEGIDKEWILLKGNRQIYYSKLPPGNYILKVKGSNSDDLWNDKETVLKIIVLPPFWASYWAYSLYFLILFLIIFTILRYYYIALNEKSQRKIKIFEIEKEREIYAAKNDFFTNVTHEIRTPLTLIKLHIEKLLKKGKENIDLSENIAMIDKHTNRLINLTNQLLDFRKAEANNYSLTFVNTYINDLIKELYQTYKPVADEKNITFKIDMPRMPLLVYVDPEAIRKLLSNLFNNALKYGENTVSIRLLPFNSDDTSFKIELKNDGYIIPAEMKEKIFEPFFRLKETEKFAGTGIGLALSRSLAELHKGVLELIKTDDNYNTFLLIIPIHQDTEINLTDDIIEEDDTINTNNNHTENSLVNEKIISILLVEDDNEIINFLQNELKSTYNIFKASNGKAALDILLVENINLVISDIMMPVMDGIELCKKIKTDIHYCHIPIILLTAKNTLTSKIEGLETGADAYIEKPFVMEYLLAQISNLLTNRNIVKDYYAHSPLANIKGIACTNADKEFLEELQKVIDDNITERDLDINTISKMMNMSRGTFYRKIKGLSNLTPNELITLSRLKKAAELLANGEYRINEVSNIVGYTLPSNFARDFNKQFGVSPSNYINMLKNAK